MERHRTKQVLCALLFAYMGLLSLEENICMQVASFVALVVITVVFLAAFIVDGDALGDQSPTSASWSGGGEGERVPAFGAVVRDCLGVVIFNFAFCVTIPSWVNEKEPGTDINTVIWGSTIGSTLLYAAVGWLGVSHSLPPSFTQLTSIIIPHPNSNPLLRAC